MIPPKCPYRFHQVRLSIIKPIDIDIIHYLSLLFNRFCENFKKKYNLDFATGLFDIKMLFDIQCKSTLLT